MAELQIKTESLPHRCEICHQSDCFDARRNYCSRCSDMQALAQREPAAIAAQTLTQSQINEQEWQNPDNWSDSVIGLYFSKRDSRIWVPKRITQLGYTLNLAHQSGALWFLALCLLPVLIMAFVIILIAVVR